MRCKTHNNQAACVIDTATEEWLLKARFDQLPPRSNWKTWLLLGGRGAGKTRAGAEWIHGLVHGYAPFCNQAVGIIALVGETLGDVREVMIDGISGLRNLGRGARPRYETSRKRLLWDNGAVAYAFSSEDPESLRGPQFGGAWCDEAAKWRHADETFDMLQFGMRLGENPRAMVTTTPKPTHFIRRLIASPTVMISHVKTRDNQENLSPNFIATLEKAYQGTRLGRQELEGELLEDIEGALWQRDQLDGLKANMPEQMRRICVAIDPPASSHAKSDACGIIVAGIDDDGIGWVIADETVQGVKPEQWAATAIAAFHRFKADTIIAEINQGGDMVTSVLRAVDAQIAVQTVRANRGKWVRSEPIAALYAQERVRHCKGLEALEDEMCTMTPNGKAGGRSPDRVDALVWALNSLMLDNQAAPKIRPLA